MEVLIILLQFIMPISAVSNLNIEPLKYALKDLIGSSNSEI